MLAALCICRCWAMRESRTVNDSFLAMCDLITAIQHIKFNDGDVERQARLLDSLFSKWMMAHCRVHGGDDVIPKCHWMGHNAEQLRFLKRIFDCFITERLNRRAKVVCRHVVNTTAFERSAVVGVLALHSFSTSGSDYVVGGDGVGKSCVSKGRRIRAGHVVRRCLSLSVASVYGCIQEDDGIELVVEVHEVLPGEDATHKLYWTQASPHVQRFDRWAASDCSHAVGWKRRDHDVLVLSWAHLLAEHTSVR